MNFIVLMAFMKVFFYMVPSSEETSFLTILYGLYLCHHYTYYTLQIMFGPSERAAIHVLHSGHFSLKIWVHYNPEQIGTFRGV